MPAMGVFGDAVVVTGPLGRIYRVRHHEVQGVGIQRRIFPNLASQTRTACSSMVTKTG